MIERLQIPVEEVRPYDLLAEGQRVYQLDHGMFDFGHWPDHARHPGVRLHVAATCFEVEMVDIGDGSEMPVKRPVNKDPQVFIKRQGEIVVVMRGVPIPPCRPLDFDGQEASDG